VKAQGLPSLIDGRSERRLARTSNVSWLDLRFRTKLKMSLNQINLECVMANSLLLTLDWIHDQKKINKVDVGCKNIFAVRWCNLLTSEQDKTK